MKLVKLSLLLLLVAFLLPLTAQDRFTGNQKCSTPAVKSEWLIKFQKGLIPRVEKTAMIQYVPIRLIIVGESDGSGYIAPLRLLQTMNELNADFFNQNIQFYIAGEIDFINSSAYYDHNFSVGAGMMSSNNINGVINVYFVGNPAGACGYFSPSRDAIAMGNNCTGTGDRTFSHELGHFLSLPHTFFGWECVEEVSNIPDPAPENLAFPAVSGCNDPNNPNDDGPLVETVERVEANCEEAGDGFCDTNPDYLMEGWGCNNQGFSPDSLTDPNGVRFAVESWNIMSYSRDNCQEGFSNDQEAAMLARLTARNIINNDGVPEQGADGTDLVHIFPEDNATLPASDFVELSWEDSPNADFYVLQLHTSQNLNGAVLRTEIVYGTSFIIDEGLIANRRYYWRVRPVNNYFVNGEFSETTRFRNGEFPTATIDQELNAAISVSPNPASGGAALRISGRDLGVSGNLNLELINAAGQVIVSRQGLSVTAAGFTETVNTAALPQGVYFLRLRLNDRLVTRRVVVTP